MSLANENGDQSEGGSLVRQWITSPHDKCIPGHYQCLIILSRQKYASKKEVEVRNTISRFLKDLDFSIG